ncbi:MAG: hypothetical protein ABR554_03190 [Pyrinomonadaceae bacterium]
MLTKLSSKVAAMGASGGATRARSFHPLILWTTATTGGRGRAGRTPVVARASAGRLCKETVGRRGEETVAVVGVVATIVGVALVGVAAGVAVVVTVAVLGVEAGRTTCCAGAQIKVQASESSAHRARAAD